MEVCQAFEIGICGDVQKGPETLSWGDPADLGGCPHESRIRRIRPWPGEPTSRPRVQAGNAPNLVTHDTTCSSPHEAAWRDFDAEPTSFVDRAGALRPEVFSS
jgi:hypothetical protein